VTARYVEMIADLGLAGACEKVPALRGGINVHEGKLICPMVAEAHGLSAVPLEL
jgi:alanine dehydrogenase